MKETLPENKATCSDLGEQHAHPIAATDKSHTDPVCGMKVAADSAKSVVHTGTTFYFCSQRCMEKFCTDPAKYLQPPAVSIAITLATPSSAWLILSNLRRAKR